MTTAARACPSCHTPLPDEAHFCLHCGTATPTEPGVPARTAATDVSEIVRARIRLDPTSAPLKGNPRFEKLLKGA
jgi:hypothetical protein